MILHYHVYAYTNIISYNVMHGGSAEAEQSSGVGEAQAIFNRRKTHTRRGDEQAWLVIHT